MPWTQRVASDPIREIPDSDQPEAHQQNMLDCVRTRNQPNCTVETAAVAVAGAHMANLAYREERKVKRELPPV